MPTQSEQNQSIKDKQYNQQYQKDANKSVSLDPGKERNFNQDQDMKDKNKHEKDLFNKTGPKDSSAI